MAEPSRFTPQELDRIEDALEGLEDVEVFDDPSPEVRAVLSQYRQVLVDTREAMPLEEVPAGVLDTVFAEARAAVAQPQASVVAATPASQAGTQEEEKPSFWRRLRRSFLIPSVALAGTAALVLWISRPGDAPEGVDQPEVATAKSPAKAKGAPAAAEDKDAAPRTPAAAAPEPDPAAAAEPDAPGAAPQQQVQGIGSGEKNAADEGSLDTLLDTKPKLEEPVPEEPSEQKKSDDDSDEAAGWAFIERADRAREDGDCAAARSDYMIATEDDDAKVRARAYAGLGLCSQQQGDDVGAEDSFERARGIDPGVSSFIAAEKRSSGTYSPTSTPKRKKKPRKKSASKASGPPAKNSMPKSKSKSKKSNAGSIPQQSADIDNAMTDPFN